MIKALLFLFVLTLTTVWSQDYQHPVSWENVGLLEVPNAALKKVDFVAAKSSFSADLSNDAVLAQIFKEYPNGVEVFFPTGDYTFKKQIRMRSNTVLKGANAVLNFELDAEMDCIAAFGKASKDTLFYGAPLSKGQLEIDLAHLDKVDDRSFASGQYYLIVDNDEDLATSSWARRRTGQIVMAKVVSKNEVILYEPLRRDFGEQVRFVPLQMAKGIGIENLEINNLNKTQQQTSNILFRYVRDSWMKEVYSLNCNYAHFTGEFITNCEISNCEFSGAHDYGSGGKGYGVALQFASGDNLILQNEFESLRHSMIVQAGANGNAFIRNDSEDAYWTDVRLPKNAAGDIVLHGNYPYANLFEQNKCNTIVIDRSHGVNGPDNLFFENTMEAYGIYCPKKASDGSQAFINNYIKDYYKWPKNRYHVKGDHFEQHNEIRGKVKPKGSVRFTQRKTFLFR